MEDMDFDISPNLGEAMMANPFKTLMLLGVTFYAGAVTGKQRTNQALSSVGGLVKSGASKAANKAKGQIERRRSMNAPKSLPMPQGSSYRRYY